MESIRRNGNSSIYPIFDRHEQNQWNGKKRLIGKNGDIHYRRIHLEDRKKYLKDLFTSLLDLSWLSLLILFILSFVFSWLFFASIWYLIMYLHGDLSLDRENLSKDERDDLSCLRGVYSYGGTILFSIETQQTIGYGTRSINERCSSGIVFLIFQSCFGLILQSLWVGLVYTRLSKPRKRRQTLIWSSKCLIALRDDYLTLQIRLADMRHRSTLVEAHLRMYFISQRKTKENENLPLNLFDMNVGYDHGRDRIFLHWPFIIEHKIDSHSPLYHLDPKQLSDQHFEILVILEGIIESTGMVTQARTSYLPSEILWGHRFQSMIDPHPQFNYTIDYSKFHQTIEDPQTPFISPALFDQHRQQRQQENC